MGPLIPLVKDKSVLFKNGKPPVTEFLLSKLWHSQLGKFHGISEFIIDGKMNYRNSLSIISECKDSRRLQSKLTTCTFWTKSNMIYLYEIDLLPYRVGRSYLVNFEYALSQILTFKHLLLPKILCPSAPFPSCCDQVGPASMYPQLLSWDITILLFLWSLSLSQPSLESPELLP